MTKSRCPSSDRACCRDLAEVWAPVPGYEGMYDVSADGRVMRVKHITGATPGRVLKPDVNHRGYHKVRLFDGRGIRTSKVHSVHRLVAAAFLGPCPPGHQVNHKDADKGHNCLANLEYVTPKQNIAHAERRGLRPKRRGEKHPHARLSERDVRTIRRLARQGVRQRDIAERFGIGESQAHRIIRRRAWAHVEGDYV